MAPEQLRLEILRILQPYLVQSANVDLDFYVKRARILEQYVIGAGQAEAPLQTPTQQSVPSPDNRPQRGPARSK
jgi:hypothetical protein